MTEQPSLEPLIDVFDHYNHPTGRTATVDDVLANGLWHRGCRVILYTADYRLLAQRRSAQAIQNPSRISLGAGGYVDAGESPEQAALREVYEETGLQLEPADIQFISLDRLASKWQYEGQQKTSHRFVYSYTAHIPKSAKLTRQPDEADELILLTVAEVEQLIKQQAPKTLGKLSPEYKYYRQLLQKSLKTIDWAMRR